MKIGIIVAIVKGILMFVVSAIVIGIALTVNWRLTVLKQEIDGKTYRFVSAVSDANPRFRDTITETVFTSEDGQSVSVQLTENFYYDPCDAYLVTVTTASGDSRTFTYTPNKAITSKIIEANKGLQDRYIPSEVMLDTFYYSKRDVTGFTKGATITDTSAGPNAAEILPASASGNAILSREELGLSENAYFVLDSITAFRNYQPYKKAMTPIVIWTPVFVFIEYVLLGIINLSRDVYKKAKYRDEKEFTPFRRSEEQ